MLEIRIIDNQRIRIEFSLWHKPNISSIRHPCQLFIYSRVSPLFFCDNFNGILLNHTPNAFHVHMEDLFFVIKILSDRKKYLFVFFLLPLFSISIVFFLRNNICYTAILRIYVSIRDFIPIPFLSLSTVSTPSFISILAFSLLLPFYLFFHSFLPPYFVLRTLFLSLLYSSTRST